VAAPLMFLRQTAIGGHVVSLSDTLLTVNALHCQWLWLFGNGHNEASTLLL